MSKLKRVHQMIQVCLLLYLIFIYIVIGIAANKSDLIDNESVSEEKARKFAQDIGAIFKLTSACTAGGIEELFVGVGSKFLDPNYKDDGAKKPEVQSIDGPNNPPLNEVTESQKQQTNNFQGEKARSQSIKLSPLKEKEKKKKKCC